MAIPIIGDIIKSVIDRGGDLISEFIPDKDKAAEFKHRLEMATLADRDLERQYDARMHEATQETIQAELHQSDLYTKRTRPIIARRSFYLGVIYTVWSSFPTEGVLGLMPLVFRWEVLLLLYSPALTYMGVRGFEKWKGGGSG